jgi:hypothetical protein
MSSTTKLTTTTNTTTNTTTTATPKTPAGPKSKKSEKKDKGYEVSRRMEGGIVVSRVDGKKVEVESW